MSIETEILRIQKNIADTYGAVADMGGSVPLNPSSENLAEAVRSIPQETSVDGNPLGTIISFMGTAAPKDYLVCDGAEYSVSDYPDLAQFFQEQFGSANYFGGDGTATFAVPDMRNLFLRGYHGESEEQLSGDIGVRQEATEIPNFSLGGSSKPAICIYNDRSDVEEMQGQDKILSTSTKYGAVATASNIPIPAGVSNARTYAARPFNMAVLYCIKAVRV